VNVSFPVTEAVAFAQLVERIERAVTVLVDEAVERWRDNFGSTSDQQTYLVATRAGMARLPLQASGGSTARPQRQPLRRVKRPRVSATA
jgi:hypothetical protein